MVKCTIQYKNVKPYKLYDRQFDKKTVAASRRCDLLVTFLNTVLVVFCCTQRMWLVNCVVCDNVLGMYVDDDVLVYKSCNLEQGFLLSHVRYCDTTVVFLTVCYHFARRERFYGRFVPPRTLNCTEVSHVFVQAWSNLECSNNFL